MLEGVVATVEGVETSGAEGPGRWTLTSGGDVSMLDGGPGNGAMLSAMVSEWQLIRQEDAGLWLDFTNLSQISVE